MTLFVCAIDQGTTSTRFQIFNQEGAFVTSHQEQLRQIYKRPGWIEHDPKEILRSVVTCAEEAIRRFELMGHSTKHIKSLGITNQRETTIVWNKDTGEPLYNAIVWGDTRTNKIVQRLQKKDTSKLQKMTGLPLHNYFSALKLAWLMKHVPAVKTSIEKGQAMFGTVDSWLIWNLTGGPNGGAHVTDVTNASRTMLMNLETRAWDPILLEFFGVPESILPEIVSSSEHYGDVELIKAIKGLPICGCLGDQQAAFVGQKCFEPGEIKNTYGTGAFMLLHVGDTPVCSKQGLISTIGYQLGRDGPVGYCLEGSIGVAGSAIEWLKDNMGIIENVKQVDELASQVDDTGGVVFVTAFSGLFAPYWRDDARGTIVGLTQFTNKCHLTRATLEAACLSTRAVLTAMRQEGHVELKTLKADGGLSNSDVCMQLQADTLGIPRPAMRETSGLGAAFAAGLGCGLWKDLETVRSLYVEGADVFEADINNKDREAKYTMWEEAVKRSYGWTQVYNDDSE
ncbi:hypothetical protein PHYBLDRAFT_164426 [Phycomyces blakesleeanus NRRL 1555(-)]|uniref:glycerol kinase n=1 Tax=Phycomyces blakesleeanus (strain ATCC 8743b / DSM 1359 / FGSC 10004 / NBRC 33097 / NRRL 1555) TaxID=763407 RepID=A0A167P9E4_PHYB8|nr:hypothetical protein PHYBLDRAFT_164426 [Phycomyces blakesleeanus NRRL 1555(-)]OAD77518.1 hypothetical protein PHYBLDRAFT_164426 [Phycomyces blakesleeanus NRRL 1555(-)]|eukprot:XP_018295558.1 hypothetical protein PHYBLDRAFT_164426 [Phycomyces blakesleeanus NRRL 1555(-)]